MRDILITSPVQPIAGVSPDIYSWDKPAKGMRMIMSFLQHPALSFLEANLPVRVLHYPDWDDFCRSLEPVPDVLGISFYINETEQALAMARYARKVGVKEIWAGNFGAYTPEILQEFDQVVHGWGESKLAQLTGVEEENKKLIHPEMYGVVGTNLFPRMLFSGTLFTSRSCPFTCNFCQTPDFYGRTTRVPLDEIERIVWTYKKRGVSGINILDENFGTFKSHSQDVVKILHKYNLRWVALTRVDTLRKNFEFWYEHGMFGAHLGIESLNNRSLSGASKRTDQDKNLEMLRILGKHNMFVQIFYILGFEEDTVESIQEDIQLLAEQDFDVAQIQVLTPYPRTEQRSLIENKFGIFEHDLRKYNSRNLVWNHPNISPVQMKELQAWANNLISSNKRVLRSINKLGIYHARPHLNMQGIALLMKQFSGKHQQLHKEFKSKLQAARQWAKSGWYAYDEHQASHTLNASPDTKNRPGVTPQIIIPIEEIR